jgi:ribonuclease P protein component
MQRYLRLRSQQDFVRMRKTGRAWRHPFLILSVAPNGLAHNRYGFVTSKALGTAVVRNRVRRVLREIVRRADPQLTPGHDMVFIARGPIAEQPYEAVSEAVVTTMQQAGLWSPPGETT